MNYFYPSVGNDPELFITIKGKLVPSEKLVPLREGGRHSVKVDNAAVELNFPAQNCLQYNLGEITRTLKILKTKYLDPRVHKVTLCPAMEIEPEDMEKCSSLHQFGCSPSLVFEKDELRTSKPNVDPREVRVRSIGYHVHLGVPYVENSLPTKILHSTEGRVRLVKMCDYVVGLPAVLLERDDKAVQLRRNLLGYGRAGEFREQPHGFEYRTLGPWPLIHPSWAWWANSAVRDALQLVLGDIDTTLEKKVSAADVSAAINTNNKILAAKLWANIKQSLGEVIVNKHNENSKHAILGLNNIRLFEFAVAKGGLAGQTFKFRSWGSASEHYTTPRQGFPSRMKRSTRSQTNWKDFLAFCNSWSLTKDNLSQHI